MPDVFLFRRHAPKSGDWPFAIVPLVKISLDFFAEIL
jgi:hypothetical protein